MEAGGVVYKGKEGMEAGGVVYNARRVWRPEG